ncbi:MAG TPA: PAS domain S-box protein [Syntrophorhabdaceae bacterium]|nr:PAS domain S-box protein [Syntrophorhabdaceae bacterium]HPP41431.1 PAS domain S-box protein [Syntrophorhabdaceae bacterium]
MDLAGIIKNYRDQMINEWIQYLHEKVSERYRGRPIDELKITVSRAFDASSAVLVENDFSKIDDHIQWITKIRLEGGFSLSEVQNAYELYRVILVPHLIRELKGRALKEAIERLNICLFYTITRFSDYFQSLHEKHIREHAQNLELEIEKRTKELVESEAKYRVLVEDINDGYFVNQNETIVFANKAFCDLHGYSLNEVIGKPYSDFVAARSLPMVKRLYERRLEGKDSKDLYMYFRRHRDGNIYPTENKVKGIIYQGSFAVAGICRDITERMEAERRIRESERLAHVGKLTTSLAHEIRNPLSSVKMNIQIITKKTDFDGNDKRRMEIIIQELSRLERILDEMLDFAKPIKLNLAMVSVNQIIDSCLDVLDVKIREKSIEIKKRYSKSIPSISMDYERMEQAIINIFLNSIEALPKKGLIEIETKMDSRGKNIKINIGDNGPGISQENLPYIFDPFFSIKKKGTGLGLTNVKRIVEAHGGSVEVGLRRPKGVVFTITMPVRARNL